MENKIFEVDSIFVEIFKESGRNFYYEFIFFEDLW